MEAATIERPAAVQGPTTAIYLARRAELTLVHTPVLPIYGASGQKVNETKGKRLHFREGRLDVPLEGEYVFDNGQRMESAELREWLDAHRLNGDASEGFWKVDPAAPAPSSDELQAIVDLAMALDIDALEATLRTELEGWQREPVIVMARRAIERVRAVLDAQDEQASAAVAEAEQRAREAEERAKAAEQRAVEAENVAKVAAQPTPPESKTTRGRARASEE